MNRAEREALIDANLIAKAELLNDMAERRQRREAREAAGYFDDEPPLLVTRKTLPIIRKLLLNTTTLGQEYIFSDESEDRFGDKIKQSGWVLKPFWANPIALFGHMADFIVGTWENVAVRDGALRGHLKLAPLGTSPRVDEVIKLCDCGAIRAVSVGFRVLESEPLPSGGTFFTKAELVECSLVSTPANSNALAVAKSLHVSDETMNMVFDKTATADDEFPLLALADELGVVTGQLERKMERGLELMRIEIATLKGRINA